MGCTALKIWYLLKVVPHSKTAMLLTNKITGNVGQPINQYKEDRDSTELMRTAKEMNVLYFITKNTYFLPILSHCLHCSKKKGTLTGEKPLVKLTAWINPVENLWTFMASCY